MKALITGSAGFVGRHISAELVSRGWDVEGWDIADGSDARILFAAERHFTAYDLVVHCAFHVGGRAAIDGDRTALAKNLELDAAMFGWAVRTRQKRVLYFSSSAAYPVALQTGEWFTGNQGRRLYEKDIDLSNPLTPDADYGWAKLTGEKLAANARDMGVNVHVVRPASGCSINQGREYPFPAIAERVARREAPLVIWGPTRQARDFIHITDVVNGALAVVDADVQTPINLGTGQGTTMGELAEMMWVVRHGSAEGFLPSFDESKPTGVLYRVLDPTNMMEYYTPKISLEQMVNEAMLAL